MAVACGYIERKEGDALAACDFEVSAQMSGRMQNFGRHRFFGHESGLGCQPWLSWFSTHLCSLSHSALAQCSRWVTDSHIFGMLPFPVRAVLFQRFLTWSTLGVHTVAFFIRVYRMWRILIKHDDKMWRSE